MDAEKLIPWIMTAISIVIAFAGWQRNSRGDTTEQARWQGGVDAKLNQIGAAVQGLNGIPERVNAIEKQLNAINIKLEKHIDDEGRN